MVKSLMKNNSARHLFLSFFCISLGYAEISPDTVTSIPLDLTLPEKEEDVEKNAFPHKKSSPQKNTSKNLKQSAPNSADLVAIVEQKPITEHDLRMRVKLILITSGIPVTDENMKMLREQVLKNMIEEYVQLGTAFKYKVAASEKEVIAAIHHMAKESSMTLSQLESMLKSNHIPIHYLKERIKAQISWVNFARAAYAHTLHVSDKEVEKRMEAESHKEKEEQFLIYEIRIAADSPSQMPMAKAQADRLINELKKGANFQTMAQQFSSSPTASKGGYVGWVTKSRESSLNQSKVYETLETGQVSYPVQGNNAYYIYLLADRKRPGQAAEGNILLSYKKITIPLTKGFKPEDDPYLAMHLNELMPATSVAEAMKIANERGLSMDDVKDRPLSQFPPEAQNFFKSLSIGKPSSPSMTPDGLVVIVLTQKRQGETPKSPSKEDMKRMIEDEKLGKIAAQNLSHLINKAFIKIMHPHDFPNLHYGINHKKS